MLNYAFKILIFVPCIAFMACTGNKPADDKSEFTEIDSLTDSYLTLQDSLSNTWNAIIGDENEKLKSLHELLHELIATEHGEKDPLIALEQRLDKLDEMRFDQDNMDDPHVVEEYDFASNSVISEIVSIAESRPDFADNRELQEWVDRVKIADQHISIYRSDYDSAASRFNSFLDRYQKELTRLDQSLSREKKPLF